MALEPFDMSEASEKGVNSTAEAYKRDGAIMLRGVLDQRWVERMRLAIARLASENPGVTLWMSRKDAEFAAFASDSGLGQIAGQIMGVDRVSFFYDQLFVKQPKSDNPTPLHQDLPYWPINGRDIISVWVPFDHVTRESSVVQYIKGSHNWGRMFEPVAFVKGGERSAATGSAGYEQIDDPQAIIETNEILSWELGPGDVLIHNPLTLHFSTPNVTENENRRAVALRYVGPDAYLTNRPGNFTRRLDTPDYWVKGPFVEGTPVDGRDFPCVWRRSDHRSAS